MRVFASAIGAALAAAAVAGCGRDRPLPPEYRTVAAHLGEDLKPDPADFRDDKPLAEVAAAVHAAVLDLRAVRSGDPDLDYLAARGADASAEAAARLDRLAALPRPPSAGEVFVGSFVYGLAGDVGGGAALGADADAKRRAIRDEFQGLAAAVDKAEAAALLLPRVAGRHAAPAAAAGDGRVAVDYDEAWNAWGPHDWCRLYNAGGDLDDCTVVVGLTGAGGEARTHVHFARRWPARSWLHARYAPGTPHGDRVVGRQTVAGVAAVDVRVLSPGYSTDVRYAYAGAEREKDVARRIKEVEPHVRPRVRDSAWGAGSGKVLVLENGWTRPVHRVRVRVESAGGTPVGEFVRPRLDAGGTMDVGSWQVSRNLTPGDRVSVWLGDGFLLATTVK